MNKRTFALGACMLTLSAHVLTAQDFMRYRDFELGSTLAPVTKLTGTAPSDLKMIHQRPAVMQDLEWRPRYSGGGVLPQTDPVDRVVFRFYNDQLFQVTVDYKRDRTEGLTDADMIEAISASYGPSAKPAKPVPKPIGSAALAYGAPAATLATWGDAESSIALVRVAYPATFRLVVVHTRLEALARVAGADAVRLDASEAPQRELARQKKESAEALAAQEKAQIENKAVFRP